MGDLTNWRTIIPKKFLHCFEGSRTHIRLSSLGIQPEDGIPRESDFEGQWDLITKLPQDWGKQRLLEGTNKTKSCVHQDPGEGNSDPPGD